MALQLLDQWYASEQKKRRDSFQVLNGLEEPSVIFIGDSLMESFPIHELLKLDKKMVNRGILASKSYQILEHLDLLVYGNKVEKIFILLGTNDLAEERGLDQILEDMEMILQMILRSHYGVEIYLLSLLPVNENPSYQSAVYIRTNAAIDELNRHYKDLAERLPAVHYLDLNPYLRDESAQLDAQLTLDGLHVNSKAYVKLAEKIQEVLS